jgi:hypothetical protein
MTLDDIRQECLSDLYTYAQVMFPKRYLGDVHKDMFRFFQKSLEQVIETGDGDNACALIPRDHQKSFCMAVTVSWFITKYPHFTSVYVSSNPKLAERQLTIVRNIFRSDQHRELWPQMLNYVKGRTGDLEHKPLGTWTKTEISVDHPDRPKGEKDPTIEATSAKSTNTGAHFKLCVFDDLVTNENYKSAAEREEMKEVYQSFSSIATTGSIMWAVGTRYGDDDLYGTWKDLAYDVYDDEGNVIETRPVWNFFERTVESSRGMDGSGTYLWPRMQMPDGNWYGFSQTELSRKKAQMLNLELFYCQYYNTANAVGLEKVSKSHFLYAEPNKLRNTNGKWWYDDKELTLHCGVDLSFTEGHGKIKVKRDFTAMSVIAWDKEGYLYVLEQRRFQTSKVEVYYQNLTELHDYWGFKETTIESNVGGSVVVSFIQDEIRRTGNSLIVKGVPSSKNKIERIELTLEPLYRNQSVFHFKGGFSRQLEEELRLARPSHDDLKDSLYIAVANSKRPSKGTAAYKSNRPRNVVNAASRFHRRRRA